MGEANHKAMWTRRRLLLPLAGLLLVTPGCDWEGEDEFWHGENHRKPDWLTNVSVQRYAGDDDLLTAGLGKDGLASSTAPLPRDLNAPTARELRRYAIYSNYRALVDVSAGGGYGTLYGPNVDANGNVTDSQGRIPGVEYLGYADDGSGRENVTMMVQIPDSFNPDRPCLITATSSGSRGVYGGIPTAEWGLKRGCAVAYTDKGTGAAPHDLDNDTVPLIDGTRTSRRSAGDRAQFAAPLDNAAREAFVAAAPHRYAFKHAHSQRNPEKDWGRYTLQAIEFGIWAINEQVWEQRQRRLGRDDVLVIASSLSNGGGAAIAAAEADTEGWIDGVAVAEPNLNLPPDTGITVRRGGAAVPASGRTLYDYTTVANLLQLCAALDPDQANAPFASYYATLGSIPANRCAALAAAGTITGATTAQRAASAQAALRDYGWEPEAAALHASLGFFEVANAVAVTFANSLARASVADRLCGFSFSGVGAGQAPAPAPGVQLANMFAVGNGIPPSADVQLINDRDPRGPRRDLFSRSPDSLVDDANAAGAYCLRGLLTGQGAEAAALQAGQRDTLRTGNLRGKPTLIVHGRDDALLPVNHTSRPYLALNRQREGQGSRLSYIEVTNAQHFDAFNQLVPGYDTRYVPLHLYLNRALDAMYAHLRDGAPLPPSQVVRTVPRGGLPAQAPAITAANVPAFSNSPGSADRITVEGNTVRVPD
ncbi:D-(-)-3-hydroxybutyrate oligomer hydrolase [Cupriavidus sp. AU9028]|uniref:D-(-)-3-hydroxybutyrate oligomer hydrolase n=1 Tax=Cupriavidus sp. AU9028 TaxID=2871157 RepID=UPI001C949C51|nr:D-(-)-3-hydroxybutyrate oligomer hydrolase [Cupriavidus sp. AU9028]MBY4898043.1 D-(-)-3-hydroxybutyrate oligomer hydrolase [Cupriavidus sp. AU9028]